ncbi:MAG TPA: hypothetical protein V6C81_23855 [Planktothrix sp.]|jgi:hypothetical protein
MNIGVFIFTLMRLFTFRSLVTTFVLTIAFPFILGVGAKAAEDAMVDSFIPTLLHSILPMLIAYTLVADTVANSKNLSDGEYLSLLFTRPIRRSTYVVTKWIAGTTGVAICVYLAYAVFLGGAALVGASKGPDPVEILNILLNCMSTTALVVVISAVPMRLGMFLFFTVFYLSMIGPMFSNYSSRSSEPAVTSIITGGFQLMQTVVTPTIDLQDLVNSVAFSWTPVVNYASNMVIYLLLATYLMSRREFYYASE